MKNAIKLAFLWLLALSVLQAADLILEPTTGGVQTESQLQLRFASEQGTTTGLQFDLEYDESSVKIEVLPGTAATLAEKTVVSASPSRGRLRILVVGFNQNVITNGVVALLRVAPKDEAIASRSINVRLAAAVATDRAGVSLELLARGAEKIVVVTENPRN